ncbi:acetyl-CoA carboxylase biotin carboxyl carrier protein subunit [Chengkuizengella axinellae]|uniref:Acetyl-CoA carboxylase biotin carboxyl carrier protein subunit n=1 Tax=Chengkuizengella axinellae TaxID=3064388 RepID=A0ABT9J556_9BACL|nr:acetyl-CoA carboxylase biotin carboxyl carrier protein subunit [Chengkuizengella sp. 2205SS18-9]MDP5276740.1 acetyl-CoA carboxylase biotin carboxyl carrier protein subunit [Chengkuizengella sp. 2205SS18-9]
MGQLVSNMAGSVWKIVVKEGDKVEQGQELVILESMKMEISLTSSSIGTVKEIKVNEGDFVNEGDVLLEIE